MTENTLDTGDSLGNLLKEDSSVSSIDLSRECCQVIEADKVIMEQSAAFSILSEEVDMQESAGFIVRAEEVRVQDSVTFLLVAGEVKGDITTLFTPVTAAILGASIMLGMWLIRPRR